MGTGKLIVTWGHTSWHVTVVMVAYKIGKQIGSMSMHAFVSFKNSFSSFSFPDHWHVQPGAW
jgi:hypothetical protein